MRWRVGFAAAGLALAGCQPLPHPLAANAPKPGAPILALPDNTSVLVAPVGGGPPATATKLAAAMAHALQQRDVAASDRTASIGSYQLRGTITPVAASPGRSGLFVLWRLSDPSGRRVVESAYALEAGAQDWQLGSDAAVARLAAASAERVAALLLPPTPAQVAGAGPRLLIAPVKGAPGDGGAALSRAIAALLARRELTLATGAPRKGDLILDGEVAVGRPRAGKEHVGIVWRLRRADGSEIGKVAEENDVPAGLLDRAWGDIAYMVAASAEDGIMQLVARATPATAQGG